MGLGIWICRHKDGENTDGSVHPSIHTDNSINWALTSGTSPRPNSHTRWQSATTYYPVKGKQQQLTSVFCDISQPPSMYLQVIALDLCLICNIDIYVEVNV